MIRPTDGGGVAMFRLLLKNGQVIEAVAGVQWTPGFR